MIGMGNVALDVLGRAPTTVTANVSRVAPGARARPLLRRRRITLLGLLAAAVFLPLLGRAPISDHEARVMFTALAMSDAGWPWHATALSVRVPALTPVKAAAGVEASDGQVITVNPWVVPVFESQVRLQKPPLPYWCTAILFRLLGPDAQWARLIPAAMAVVSTLLLFDLARLLLGRRRAWLAALVWVSTYFVIDEFRESMADPYLAFAALAAVWAWVCASEQRPAIGNAAPRRGPIRALVVLFYLCCGLGLLAKGPVVLLHVVVPVVLYALLYGRRPPGAWRAHALGAALMLAVALPWPLMVLRHVDGAIALWWYESLGEFTVNRRNARPWWFYLPQLPLLALPWVVPCALGAARGWPRRRGAWRRRALAPAWLIALALVFSLAQMKKNAYLLPVMPAQCLMAATGLNSLIARYRLRRTRPGAQWVLFGQAAAAMGLACVVTVLLFVHRPHSRFIPTAEQITIGALAMMIGVTVLLMRAGRDGGRLVVAQAVAFALLTAMLIDFPAAVLARPHEENRLPVRGTASVGTGANAARLVWRGAPSYDPSP
jgi:4-amino-4-deoxy-L-arabinose transferase-like glycosyltransferase